MTWPWELGHVAEAVARMRSASLLRLSAATYRKVNRASVSWPLTRAGRRVR